MAYDPQLAERLLRALAEHTALSPERIEIKKMFGGVAYMVNGAMCVGVMGERLVARASDADAERYLEEPGVRPMDFTGKPMKGWLYVEGPSLDADETLARWV